MRVSTGLEAWETAADKEKCDFLAVYDYEVSGVWAIISANSAEEIGNKYLVEYYIWINYRVLQIRNMSQPKEKRSTRKMSRPNGSKSHEGEWIAFLP